jgi:hypothetical protein
MVLVDRLIHSWHWETQRQRPRFGLGRPTGVNLIEGSRKQVLAFLDGLTYGAENTRGIQATKAVWHEHREEVKARPTAWRANHPTRRQAQDPE